MLLSLENRVLHPHPHRRVWLAAHGEEAAGAGARLRGGRPEAADPEAADPEAADPEAAEELKKEKARKKARVAIARLRNLQLISDCRAMLEAAMDCGSPIKRRRTSTPASSSAHVQVCTIFTKCVYSRTTLWLLSALFRS